MAIEAEPRPVTGRASALWRPLPLGIGFTILSAVMLRTTPRVLTDTVPFSPGDSSLVIWVLSWGTRSIGDPTGYFDGNIFWPHDDTLAYHDTLLPLVPPWAVLHGITGSWQLALNLLALGLVAANLGATFALTKRLTGRQDAALVAALAFGFSGYVMAHSGHVQLLAVGLLPLDFLLLLRTLERPGPARGAWLGLATAATFLVSAYYGIVWVFCMAAVIGIHVVVARKWPPKTLVVGLAVGGAVAAAVALPTALAMLRLQEDPAFRRPIEATDGFHFADLLHPAPRSWVYGDVLPRKEANVEHDFFPGFSVMALAALGAFAFIRPRSGESGVRRVELGLVAVGGAVAVVLSRTTAGPFRIPLPIFWMKRNLPGMTGLRVPARFAVVGLLVLAVLAGIGAARLLARRTRPGLWLAAIGAVILVELAAGIPRPDLDDSRAALAVYRELDKRADGPVVELPMGDPTGTAGAFTEAPRMVYGTIDWQRRVNGYSAFVPANYLDDVSRLNAFPSAASLRRLDELDARYVVLHTGPEGQLGKMTEQAAQQRLARLPSGATAERHGSAWLITLSR